MATEQQIPYVDLVGQTARIKSELLKAVESVLDSGQFVLGDVVGELECDLAGICNTKFAIGMNSGTDALALVLRSYGIGPGDEVITAPNSFIASASCVGIVGAKPVFADVRDDFNIDPAKIEAAITPNTKAIIPVHLTGRPADMDPIMEIASRHNLKVIEDAAQSIGAEYKGRPVGSLGHAGCFSLHPLKTLNACGDAGFVSTDDEQLKEQLLLLRNLGLKTRENCVVWSSNSRLDSMQAAILRVKMKYLAEWTEGRIRNAGIYRELLAGVKQIVLPPDRESEKAVYHTFIIQAERRDELKQHLADRGIGSSIHYPVPIHMHDVAGYLGHKAGDFPVTEAQAEKILSLPVFPELEKAQLERVAGAIREFYN